jgi:hypothetical protein
LTGTPVPKLAAVWITKPMPSPIRNGFSSVPRIRPLASV